VSGRSRRARSAGSMRTEPSTEKPPPCSHCAIARASSTSSIPRCTKTLVPCTRFANLVDQDSSVCKSAAIALWQISDTSAVDESAADALEQIGDARAVVPHCKLPDDYL
jgi:hypothetical protein